MQTLTDFGPYRLDCILKSGGMAVLYLATEELLPGVERKVVLKRISPENRSDEQFVTMFFDEVRLMAGLSHPGLPHILDAGTVNGEPYFVMEFIDGLSLAEVFQLRQKPLPKPAALYIALALAETLAYVHGHRDAYGRPSRIVHRDLTPANVIVSTTGVVKLIDFGIAHGENRVYQTATGVMKGTLGYMAPEMLMETQPLTQKADLFCFGVLLYEMLTGTPPFVASNPLRIHDLISRGTFLPPSAMSSSVGAAMDQLITNCLATSPDARPGDMWEVVTTIQAEAARTGGLPLRRDVARFSRGLKETHDQAPPPMAALPDGAPGHVDRTTEVDLNRPSPGTPGKSGDR